MTPRISLLGRKLYKTAGAMLFGAILATPVSALEKAQASEVLDQIYQTTIHSYYSVNSFYNFSANQADQRQLTSIKDAISSIGDNLDIMETSLAEGATAETFGSVRDSWDRYEEVLNENIDVVVDTGYPDLRLAGDMATTNIALNDALDGLYNNVINVSSFNPDDIVKLSREASTNLALMMTKYSARSTSTVSQVYTGGDTEITIDSLASEFEKQLDNLISKTGDNATASELLDAAKTKWDFIRSSYVNYNENRVNFIVNLYSKKIIDDIQGAAANY